MIKCIWSVGNSIGFQTWILLSGTARSLGHSFSVTEYQISTPKIGLALSQVALAC